jgi:tRNA-Thr(GGU) m(6)t(6)A37 methyltransferase TsaA
VRSSLTSLENCPRQGTEGAPDAWLEIDAAFAPALAGIVVGDRIAIITWLHKAQRDILQTYPRNDRKRPLAGVFATRSPDRPNPLGLHVVTVCEIAETRLRVAPLEALNGTPIIVLKPVLPDES